MRRTAKRMHGGHDGWHLMDGIWMALRKDDYNVAIRRFVATRVGCSERYAYGLSSLEMHSSTFKLLLRKCCLCGGLSALVIRNKSVWRLCE
jgi:hypothetical protein